MSANPSERRMAENEMVFRQLNVRVQEGIERTEQMAREDSQPEFLISQHIANMPLYFYCECSDENCTKRIPILHDLYTKIRQHRNHFVVAPGHEVLAIERVIARNNNYYIVKKFVDPPDKPPVLHATSIDNS